MCEAVRYYVENELLSVSISQVSAKLPVLLRDGTISLLPWGRRKDQQGKLPVGGTADIDTIYSGRWDKYFPTPVKIPYAAYMLRDFEERIKWYENLVPKTTYIQGLVAKEGNERRVYIVTRQSTVDIADFHDRMPRLI